MLLNLLTCLQPLQDIAENLAYHGFVTSFSAKPIFYLLLLLLCEAWLYLLNLQISEKISLHWIDKLFSFNQIF